MKKNILSLFLFCFFLVPSFAKVRFSGLDLGEDGRLVFRCESRGDGSFVQNGVFVSRLQDLSITRLSAFPEKLDLLENGRVLQVRNAFGLSRLPLSGGLPEPVPGFPSFAEGFPLRGGRIEESSASPDGRWILRVNPVSHAFGELCLVDTSDGSTRVLAGNVERPGKSFPACWSPDSRVIVYNRNGRLYYYMVNSSAAGNVDERYRLIGEGSIASVAWTRGGEFFYLKGSTLYRVRGPELFARSLYANFLDIGTVAGKIPFDFDPGFDEFWMAPDSASVIVAKGGRTVFYFSLDEEAGAEVLPCLVIPWSSYSLKLLWSPAGIVTVIAGVFKNGKQESLAWRLESKSGGISFSPLSAPRFSGASLSPDGSKALFWGEPGVSIYDYVNWKSLAVLSGNPAQECLWINNEEMVCADGERIDRVYFRGERVSRELICLSGAAEAGFGERGNRILAKSGNRWYATDGSSPWTETAEERIRKPVQLSGTYRVYLENQSGGPCENLPMIRNVSSVGTQFLIPAFEYEADEAPVPPSVETGSALFSHGLRKGLREVALCFDLYDDAEGLPQTLESLRRFGYRASFFLNGEFIRRHPAAAASISGAGHETASMFYAPIDLSDVRYQVGGDYIARGLARNEDEFFKAAGAELSLLWHPPWYSASEEIISAAAAAGYRTIGRDVDPLDWVSRDDARRFAFNQYSAPEMIDRIMSQKLPGSIIPVRLGILPGGRSDYLFLKLELLLDALARSGYTIVPVSTLIEHAR
ncbi:MAG: polysaccharide deacetylase family protein [Treponema sp.]|jgi:peptidoglycan/xylan/chitin deacetylase (PgdA/CDA1 family)|nr:polysaccharide deacetylase family protein [Treponema sp.]